jgi:hypothetical protein
VGFRRRCGGDRLAVLRDRAIEVALHLGRVALLPQLDRALVPRIAQMGHASARQAMSQNIHS